MGVRVPCPAPLERVAKTEKRRSAKPIMRRFDSGLALHYSFLRRIMPRDREKENARTLERRQKRRRDWLRRNGPCRICGSWENLEVDHIDPDMKVDHKVWAWSVNRRLAELAKCQVLCRDCHKKKTRAQVSTPITHGLISSYIRRGCRCDVCSAVNAEHVREWKERTGYGTTTQGRKKDVKPETVEFNFASVKGTGIPVRSRA